MSNPITKYESEVRRLLIANPLARDNDNYLFSLLIYNWAKRNGSHPELMTATMLLSTLSHDPHAPSFESVSRCRRKLQELDPTLRGKTYYKRRGMKEAVKNDLGYGK